MVTDFSDRAFMETELKQLKLNDSMATKDVIVLTSIEEQAISWLTSYYQKKR